MGNKGSVIMKVTRYIQKNIQDNQWAVGDRIPSENELCETLNVSRVSVRSAIKQFVAFGILESVHGKGTFLRSNDLTIFAPAVSGQKAQTAESLAAMQEILEFRSMVEPSICEMVAPQATPELIARLEECLSVMRDSLNDSKRFVEADMDFHMAICQATDNPVTVNMMHETFNSRAELNLMLNLTCGCYGGIYYHALLLDAFKKNDGKRASALMLEHLHRSLDDMRIDNELV